MHGEQGKSSTTSTTVCNVSQKAEALATSSTGNVSTTVPDVGYPDKQRARVSNDSSQSPVGNQTATNGTWGERSDGTRLCTPARLSLFPRDLMYCVDNLVLNLPRNNPCCRYPITVKDRLLEACIDSGATICLMSREAYKRIKDVVGPLKPTKRTASGASGKNLKIDGWIRMPFKIGASTYTYSFLVGDLSGIDCLLGLDWLQSVKATIDFSTMKAVFGPTEEVQLSSEPLEINFCRVIRGQTLESRAHTKVDLKATWETGRKPVMFEPTCITLGPGLTIASGIVQPDDAGEFVITIQNDTNVDVELPDDVIIGFVDELDSTTQRGRNATDSPDVQGYCIWRVAEHRASPLDEAEDVLEAGKRGDILYVSEPLVHTEESEPAGDLSTPDKHFVRLVETEEQRPEERDVLPPESVRCFDIHGNEVPREQMTDCEYYDFLPEVGGKLGLARAGGSEVFSASSLKPSSVEQLKAKMRARRQVQQQLRLPEHLRCVLPPPEELNRSQLILLVELILEFQDVFVGPDGKVGQTTLIEHQIDTGDAEPTKCHPRKKSPMEREHIAKEVKSLLKDGFIRPSMSPWGSPVVLAKKKDGTLRFCIDYRALNHVTKKDAYPLPRIEECLDCLHGMMYYCCMDCCKGYWQVPMHAGSIEKTAFSTHVGLFEWTVLPFGLCNAPATFCRLMEMVLADIVWKHCLVYLDDVIAFGRDFQETLISLRKVLERLRTCNLKLKASKCEFFRTKVEYLGHEVGRDGLRPSLSKVQALHDWKLPTDLTQVKSFLGFTSFYRRYIRNYSKLAKPLSELTKGPKGKPWEPLGPEQIKAFNELIAALTERVLLHHVRNDRPFYLTTDASNYAIGASLEQVDKDGDRVPLAFASKTLPDSRIHYCATKKELYAIVYFMRYFVGFYRGQHVYIETDHYALRWLWKFVDPVDSMYFRWMTEMNNYEPWSISYLPGEKNVVADALSRKNKPEPDTPRPRRDCRIKDCEICEFHFRKDEKCRDSDSPEEDGGIIRYVHDSCRTLKGPAIDSPDEGDYSLWDLKLVRSNENPLFREVVATVQDVLETDIDSGRQGLGPRRSERIARREAERRAAEQSRSEANIGPAPSGDASRPRHRDVAVQKPSSRPKYRYKEGKGVTAESPASAPTPSSATECDNGSKSPVTEPSTSADAATGREESSDGCDDIPTMSERDELRLLDQLLTEYSVNDWVIAQKKDLVISRLVELLSKWSECPCAEDVKSESDVVRSMLKDWNAYEFDQGILCRRVLRLQHTTCDPGTLQRLVPLAWRRTIWQHMHGIECHHLSYEKVYDMISRRYYWYNMSQDVLEWGSACINCQKAKPGIRRGIEPLKQDYTSHRNERVAMDLVGVLPETPKGNVYILVMQDYYTKWVELAALPDKQAANVAQALVASWVCRWGCPENLHSDQGNEFCANVFLEVCELLGIHKTRTTPFNPSSNGMVERTNRTLKSLLRAMAGKHFLTTWDTKLPLAMCALNNVIHSTTGFSPFRLQVAGNEDMLLPSDIIFGKANPINYHCYDDFVFQLKCAMQEVFELVRATTNKRMALQRRARDRGPMRIRRYNIGDLCLRYYPPWASQKLHPFDWQGPYEVLETDPEGLKVLLKGLPGKGRKAFKDTWIHVSALKPVILTKCGKYLQQLEDGSWQEIDAGVQQTSDGSAAGPAAGARTVIIPPIAGFKTPTFSECMFMVEERGVVYWC